MQAAGAEVQKRRQNAEGAQVSIDRRFILVDNNGWQPCLDPVALGRLMDKVCEGRGPTLRARVVKALANLRRRLAR